MYSKHIPSLFSVGRVFFLSSSSCTASSFPGCSRLSCPFFSPFAAAAAAAVPVGAAKHAFLSRTLCFSSASQPLNHIGVTSQRTRRHTSWPRTSFSHTLIHPRPFFPNFPVAEKNPHFNLIQNILTFLN